MENEVVEKPESLSDEKVVSDNELRSEDHDSKTSDTREDRRAKHDFLRYKQEAREAKERNETLLREIETLKEKSLLEKQNYKELYENEKMKTAKFQEETQRTRETFFGSLKKQQIKQEAMKMGIREEALSDLDLLDSSTVITETTSNGNVNILGAQEFVEQLKDSRPYWFKQQGAPTINGNVPSYNRKSLTASDLLKLQMENPAKYREEIMRRTGLLK